MGRGAKVTKPKLKFHFINPNTDEQTIAFLAKLLPEVIYKNQIESGEILHEIGEIEKSS